MAEREQALGVTFSLGAVLSVTTGRLLSTFDELYEILNFMTGDNLFTHQLPRACRECAPVLLAQHPDLKRVEVPEDLEGEAAVNAWLATQTPIYGDTLPVTPLDATDHTRIDPITELRMMRPDMPIVTVVVPEDGEPS